MVGPTRPQIVLFGSSIVQYSFDEQGWGASLANTYARKADVFLRGYSGWNSRQALQVVNCVFPKDSIVQPSLVIVYFGGNDSMQPPQSGTSSHAPLDEYIENMRKIAIHLKNLSAKTRLIFLSVPPVNEAMIRDFHGDIGRTNEGCRIYSEACIGLCREMGVDVIDLWTTIQKRDDWLNVCFMDGIHLSAEGSKIVAREIMKTIKEADWDPSLYWDLLPLEYGDVITMP